ncbi:immune inhibitor A, partial [bacterium]|nr:immune inhibitor A [bacterium]
LGLPDLYDINYTAKPAPVGKYCLMASGSSGGNPMGSIPAHMCAWCKAQIGWITPTEISTAGSFTIDDVHTHATNCSYKVSIPESLEHFFITNRWMDADIQFAGMPARFDGGLLVYHVDDNYSSSNDGRSDFWRVIIEDATPGDGYDLANGGFGASVNDNFGRFTDPNTDSNYHDSGITLYDISHQGEQMSFSVSFSSVLMLRDYQLVSLGGNRYALNLSIENITHIPAANLNLDISTTAGNVTFENSQVELGSVNPNTTVSTLTPFIFKTTDDVSGFATFTIVASGPSFQGKNIPFSVPINPARVLLVDDDHTKGAEANLDQYWLEGMDQTGISYQVWTTWQNEYPRTGMMNVYDLIVWCDGKGTSAVPKSPGALDIIEDYLDSGGDLIWSSQEFLFAEYGMPDDQDHILTEPGDFAREYLHILELEHDEYFYHATGVAGTITEGMNLELVDVISEDPTGEIGTFYWWPDEFITDGTCISILAAGDHEWPYANDPDSNWTDDQVDNALINESCAMLYQGQHRIMFMAASLHGITTNEASTPNTRQEFFSRIFTWFGVTPSEPGLDIDVNDPMLLAGDLCHVTLKVFNPGPARSVNTFVAMEAYGLWLFGPTWTEEASFYPMDLLAANTLIFDIFPEFAWPAGAGAGSVTMWSVMLDGDTGAMLGNYDFTPLSWM